ncbi:unnamed protein product [Moneuplotes crassus]|uniref:Uncharacterized protein n=1 Tax=Euplotes crassus TaxID=5936 RepID=A0AAD1Y563_EUPCR|nr:unnamed protein product [Moneuplotes crassus]
MKRVFALCDECKLFKIFEARNWADMMKPRSYPVVSKFYLLSLLIIKMIAVSKTQ